MIEKIYGEIKGIQEMNRVAADLRKLHMKEEIFKLAEKYNISKADVEDYIAGKRYFLVDGGDTETLYESPRSKVMDEMIQMKEPYFGDIIGSFLLECCKEEKFGALVIQPHKTLHRCVEYLMDQAYQMVDEEMRNRGQNTAIAVRDDSVYEWAKNYYAIDDIAQVEEKYKEAEGKFATKHAAAKTDPKSAHKQSRKASRKTKPDKEKKTEDSVDKTVKKEENEQLSLFDAGMIA